MLHHILLASVCYVILASCSGQNLKSQNVQISEGSKPAESQSKAGQGADPITSDAAKPAKEIAGSFLTECEVFSSAEVGCNIYQRLSTTSFKKVDQSYTQRLVLVRSDKLDEIKSKRSSATYQKIYDVDAMQMNFIKANSREVKLVYADVDGIGPVGFKTAVSISRDTASAASAVGEMEIKPGRNKASYDLIKAKNFVVDPSHFCKNSEFDFVAQGAVLTVQVKSTTKSELSLSIDGAEPLKQKNPDPDNVSNPKKYSYKFNAGNLHRLATLRFEGLPVETTSGFKLYMESNDSFTNCEFNKIPASNTAAKIAQSFFSHVPTETQLILKLN